MRRPPTFSYILTPKISFYARTSLFGGTNCTNLFSNIRVLRPLLRCFLVFEAFSDEVIHRPMVTVVAEYGELGNGL